MERRDRAYLTIPLLLLTSTLALGATIELHGGAAIESLDPSAYPIVMARAKSKHQSRGACAADCRGAKTGDLNWDVACSDYCTCLWETDNCAHNADRNSQTPLDRIRLLGRV